MNGPQGMTEFSHIALHGPTTHHSKAMFDQMVDVVDALQIMGKLRHRLVLKAYAGRGRKKLFMEKTYEPN